jgi:hypothetical protein
MSGAIIENSKNCKVKAIKKLKINGVKNYHSKNILVWSLHVVK